MGTRGRASLKRTLALVTLALSGATSLCQATLTYTSSLKRTAKALEFIKCGGAGGTRTPYLFNAIEALSRLSYSPTRMPHKGIAERDPIYQSGQLGRNRFSSRFIPFWCILPPGGDAIRRG